MQCPIHTYAGAHPGLSALMWQGNTLSYSALDSAVNSVQLKLVAGGICRGDRVGIVIPNCFQSVLLIFALFRIGAVAVPISTRFPASRIAELTAFLGCKATFGDNYSVQAVTPDAENLSVPDVEKDILASTQCELNQEATILFSSGSTGQPKAILHSWGNHYYSAEGSNKNIPLQTSDRWLLSLPLYHVAGIAVLFRCFLAGATVVIPALSQQLSDTIQASSITHISLVSTQLSRLLDQAPGSALPSVKHVLLGGSAISTALLKRAREAGWPLHTSYGMTEMGSQVTTTAPGASFSDLQTSGRLLQHRSLKFDENGQILVKGKTLCLGFVTEHGLESSVDSDGWYATGDLGAWNERGQLEVFGRTDNMFISGGENIHPEEIERALEGYGGVQRAVVVPVPDIEFGYRPVAYLEVAGDMPKKKALEVHLAEHLARFMQPIAYFPMQQVDTASGIKVSRGALAAHAERQLG